MASVKARSVSVIERISQVRQETRELIPGRLDPIQQQELIDNIESALKQERAKLAAYYRQRSSIERRIHAMFRELAAMNGLDEATGRMVE